VSVPTRNVSAQALSPPYPSPRVFAMPSHSRILILDFGSQVTQLIARRLREAHVYCEIHPWDVGDEFVRAFAPKGIVLSGSHESVHEAGSGREATSREETRKTVSGCWMRGADGFVLENIGTTPYRDLSVELK